ncbi:hypothetical protein HY605_00495, partial [Candidatus Peregrinibacteria bacterium]|nr:hypothetical protein [Candidatus Peregrinibacteria bacterium]
MGGIVFQFRILRFASCILVFAVLPLFAQEIEEQIYRQDFEKPGLYKLIDNWDKVSGAGYPFYNTVELEFDKTGEKNARGGKGYIIMTTLGGNTAYEIDKKIIKIDAQKSYLLKAHIKMIGANSNKAYLSLRWLNNRGDLIYEDRSAYLSNILDWTELMLDVDSVPADAFYAQIRLNFEGADLRGKCWFDDILLFSKPKVEVDSLGHKGNIFNLGEAIKFKLTIPSLKLQHADAEYLVRGYDGNKVATLQSRRFEPVKGDEIILSIKEVGYYEILATISVGGKVVNTKDIPFTVVGGSYFPKESGRDFGVVINPYLYNFDKAPFFIDTLELGKAKVVIWDISPESRNPPTFGDIHLLTENLWIKGCQPIAVIARPPRNLFKEVNSSALEGGVPAVFGLPMDIWGDRLKQSVVDLSEYVQYWQIGADGAKDTLPPEVFRNVVSVIKDKKEFSSIGVPIDFALQGKEIEGAGFYSVDARGLSSPEDFIKTRAEFNLPPGSRKASQNFYTIGLRHLPAGNRFEAINYQLEDFLKRCIYAKKMGAESIFLPFEEDDTSGLLNSEGIPNVSFSALKTVNDILSGARYDDKNIFAPPIKDFVFHKGGQAVVALWSEEGEQDLELFLGDNARIVEPLGKVIPINIGKHIK